MKKKRSIGLGGTIMLAVLVFGTVFCGVHAILADSVTTPAKFGGDHRVHGTDTILVGVGWIVMGLAITAKIALGRRNGYVGTVTAVILAIVGGLFWVSSI